MNLGRTFWKLVNPNIAFFFFNIPVRLMQEMFFVFVLFSPLHLLVIYDMSSLTYLSLVAQKKSDRKSMKSSSTVALNPKHDEDVGVGAAAAGTSSGPAVQNCGS